MVPASAECSTTPFAGRAHRNISVLIMTRCSKLHRWQATLRVLEIDEIKTVPHVPLSHPFVERLIETGTIGHGVGRHVGALI